MKIGLDSPRPSLVDGHLVPGRTPLDGGRAPPPHATSFRQVMERLAGEVDQGEAVVVRALRAGAQGDENGAMIALQAGVYRYVEAVDLCTRLVDRAAGAVRTTLQSQ